MPVGALTKTKKMLFLIFCFALLVLFSAPAEAAGDPCVAPTIGTTALPVGTATGCGVLITITGTSGNLVATVTGGGTANGNPYDGGPGGDDELIGIQNNTGVNGTGAVTIGAIRLSAPPTFAIPFTVTCTSVGQTCSPAFSTSVTAVSPGPITATYTASIHHCSDVQVQVSVDNTVLSTSAFLSAGQSTGPIATSPLTAGLHTVAIQATGEVGGCNGGTLSSWGGTLTLSGNITAPANSTPISSPFAFDGDGPCNYAEQHNENPNDCFAGEASGSNPFDYYGPDNAFVGISPDYTTGTVRFTTPIPPNGSTWFALENTPFTVVSIGETQQLVTGVTNVFPFGPFVCTSDPCGAGNGTWTEQSNGDDAQFTPVSQLIDFDQWTVLPIPVCAGPLGDNSPSPPSNFGPFAFDSTSEFVTGNFGLETPSCPSYGPPGFVTNFGPTSATTFGSLPYPNQNSLALVPYLDYTSLASEIAGAPSPMGVEFERDCIESGEANDCGTVQWTMQLDYDIDNVSLGNSYLLGGPVIGFAPGVPGPTTPTAASEDPFNQQIIDFSVNAITSYTGAATGGDPPPPKGGGKDGKSVFASLFSPEQSVTNPIPAGVTVGFPGFEVPTSNTLAPSCSPESAQYLLFPSGKQVTVKVPAVNCLLKVLGIRVPWPLVWDYTTNSNTPINNLQLCPSVSAGPPLTCNTPGVNPPWVHLSLVPVANCGAFAGQDPLSGIFTNLNPAFPGQYSFVWAPLNNAKGCEVAPVLQFYNGTIAVPAVFLYSY